MAIRTVCISIIEITYNCCRILKGVGVLLNFFIFLLCYLAFLVSLNTRCSYLVAGDTTPPLCFVNAQYEVSRFRCSFMVLRPGDAPRKGEEIAFGYHRSPVTAGIGWCR